MSANHKEKVLQRARGLCEYCKSPSKYSSSPFTIDHIIPISAGGGDELDNLAYSCGGCNGHKYNRESGIDTITGDSHRLFNPRKDSWYDHFQWNSDQTHIVGITPIGRATVFTLKMNRPSVINLRNITKLTGEHPPD